MLELTRENLATVIGLPDAINDFIEVTRGTVPVLYYDTTFTMGDFYVSTLLYRSEMFEGSPVMPLLMLIHERRTTDSHQLMFHWFSKLTKVTKVTCVVDREPSITNAIKSVINFM